MDCGLQLVACGSCPDTHCLPAAPPDAPLLHCPPPQFLASEENRARYWARSFAGWHKFSSVRPNPAHDGIARLQHAGTQPGRLVNTRPPCLSAAELRWLPATAAMTPPCSGE